MSSASTSLEALSLYKSLLRYSRGLTLTDKAFFRKRIRSEFEASRKITSKAEVDLQLKRARALLERKAVV